MSVNGTTGKQTHGLVGKSRNVQTPTRQQDIIRVHLEIDVQSVRISTLALVYVHLLVVGRAGGGASQRLEVAEMPPQKGG